MPIQFRCAACDRLLGIARRKAGTMVNCPRCGASVIVPALAGMAIESPGPGGNSISLNSVVVSRPEIDEKKKSRSEPRRYSDTVPLPKTTPVNSLENLPLFERSDFETLLNPVVAKATSVETKNNSLPEDLSKNPKSEIAVASTPAESFSFTIPETAQTSDVDVLSGLVVTRQKLTIAAVVIAVLLGLAFAAGYFLAIMTVAAPQKAAATNTADAKI